MTLKTLAVYDALTSKGFVDDCTHHHLLWYYRRGKKTSIRTRVSHGSREIGDALIGQMCKQVMLPKKDFLRLVECTLSAEEYLARMDVVLGTQGK